MRRQLWCLVLMTGLLGATAAAQEIVIEPTNGSTPAREHSASGKADNSRQPAAQQPKAHPVSRVAPHSSRPASRTHIAARKAAKKASGGEDMRDTEAKRTETTPATATPAMAENEATAPKESSSRALARPDWAMDDTRDAGSLQSEIASALARDPRLQRSAIEVKVDGDEVTLEGRAEGPEERVQAKRLAQSYAWNHKLVDHIQVAAEASQK